MGPVSKRNKIKERGSPYRTLITSFPPRIAISMAAFITFLMLTFEKEVYESFTFGTVTFSLCLKFFVFGAPPK